MLSWLERGLPPDAPSDEIGEITEFLVAPFQSKGAESGAAKKWVDRIRRERESQETRRTLYVAATRAREELHLFARPSYKTAQDGSVTLVDTRESFLSTAWPAFEDEIRSRFETWRAPAAAAPTTQPTTIDSLAASAAISLSSSASAYSPTRLRRLPPDFCAAHPGPTESATESPLVGAGRLYERHEGGLLSRALGSAVHAFLQQLAQLLVTQPWDSARASLAPFEPRIAAQVRAAGIDPTHAGRVAAQAPQIALDAAADPWENGSSRRTPMPPARFAGRESSTAACAASRSIASSAPDPLHNLPPTRLPTPPGGSSTTKLRTKTARPRFSAAGIAPHLCAAN